MKKQSGAKESIAQDLPGSSGPEPEKSPARRRPPRKRRKKTVPQAEPAPAVTEDGVRESPWDLSRFQVLPAENKTRFHDLDLPESLMHAISDLGFEYCTPIQAEILPSTLAGKDASGRAQTGTGKTAAFLVTVITRLLKDPARERPEPGTPRILVLAPTRELVLQISEEARQLTRYCDLNVVSVFGGMGYEKQIRQLSTGAAEIVVATPGRLLDFQRRGEISLKKIEVLIIDEADRMLDMGFIPDVRAIVHSTPPKDRRQTLMFSATLTGEIIRLAAQWTRDPVFVEIEPEQVAVDSVDQVVYIVTASEKFALLYNIIHRQNLERVLVFCNRRDEVSRLARMLTQYGIDCAILSGEVPQKTRIQRLDGFKAGKIRVLVATDVAGRGIHIEGMAYVINFTLPWDPEDYVHRIGRTGRAGAKGTSISFADEDDAFYIPPIEKLIGRTLSCIDPEPEWLSLPEPAPRKKGRGPQREEPSASRGRGRPSGGRSGRPRRRPGS